MSAQIIFLAEVLSAAFTLWLGLYVITRDLPWRSGSARRWLRPALLSGSALILFSVYLYGIAMESAAPTATDFLRWQKSTWWGIPIAVLFFVWAVMLLTHVGEQRRWARVFYPVTFVYAIALAIGIASGLMLNESAIQARDSLFQPYYTPMEEPFIHFFHPFILGGLVISFVLLLVHYQRAPRHTVESRRVRWLTLGSLFLLVGGMVSLLLPPLDIAYAPKQIGDYLATAGAAIISFGIARHNALEHEQLLEHDFWHSLVTVAVSVGLYILAYSVLSVFFQHPMAPLAIIALSALAVLTQTPYNWSGAVFDRIMLPRWAVAYRSRLVLMRQDSLTAPDPVRLLDQAEESFGDLVRSVRRDEVQDMVNGEVEHIFQYTRFDNPEVLAASRLHQLQTVQEGQKEYADAQRISSDELSSDQKAEALRCYLESAIDDWLCAPHVDPDSPEHIEQVILRKKYTEGRSRTEVERHLHDIYHVAITGGAYSRHLRRARQRLAEAIVDHELAFISSPA